MAIHKWISFLFIITLFPISAFSQDSLKLSREQCEAIFLEENLLLIAEKLQISQAEAMVLQASLWPNPTFEIDEVNLWATKRQLAVFGDELQGFNGGRFGRNQQLSFSVEQLILTAGKRKKLMALEQVTVDKSKEYFEELLRNLKLEFRGQLTQLQYLQLSTSIYQNQLRSVKEMTQSYQKQVDAGNIPKGEYIRLKALELEISKNINDLKKEINEAQKELKLLMRLPYGVHLEVTPEGYLKNADEFDSMDLPELLDMAREFRPDLKIAGLEETYFTKLRDYEQARRVPDVTLKAGYDRGGNFLYNFIGFGVAIDIPVFDRNQGNIQSAQIGMEHSRILYQQKELSLENETVLAYQNLRDAIEFFTGIEADYDATLDELLTIYTRNFINRNISLLEYLDFFDAYLENKAIILDAGKDVHEKAEELNYAIGMDVIN